MEEIRKRFLNAVRLISNSDEITTASGMKIRGRYMLIESGAITPSHDPLNGFRKYDGFPTDANGNTVNDRDYEQDMDAQKITRSIADNYDARALSSAVVVSPDGIVLSGNGRIMAGMLAAKQNTDSAYIDYITRYANKYGFTADDVARFKHPRIVLLTDDNYPYTAETFAMFNAQEIKSQSKTEQAVKLGKLVDTATFNRIIRNINTFDTIGDFYGNVRASTEAINELLSAGVVSQMQYPEMFDGDSISNQAKDILENVLIGMAFSANPDAVRQITAFKGVRRNVITALAEISNNISLGDYSLEHETADAIALCYQARSNGNIGHGEIVSGFARQTTMFAETETVADFANPVTMFLADLLNHQQVTRLKKVFTLYNREAKEAASGQVDMFSGGVKSKADILAEVKAAFSSLSQCQLDQRLTNAAFERRIDAVTASTPTVTESEPSALPHGVEIGKPCSVILPSHEIVTAKLEIVIDGMAGVRLSGFRRIKVPLTSLMALLKDAA